MTSLRVWLTHLIKWKKEFLTGVPILVGIIFFIYIGNDAFWGDLLCLFLP